MNIVPASLKRLMAFLGVVAVLLMIPMFAMKFTNEGNWNRFDFIVAAVLLLGTAFLCELIFWRIKEINARIAFCGLLFLLLLMVWAELAVGIFGTPFAGS